MAATRIGLPVGSMFADRFRIEAMVGAGPMGEVYRVRDASGVSALKVFSPRVLPAYISAEKVRAIYAERAAVHPAVVRPAEIGDANGMKFLVMPYVNGVSLQTLLSRLAENEQTGDPHTAALIADRVAAILGELPGFAVHGGIKPSNVLVAGMKPDGLPPPSAPFYLTDMGSAYLLSFSKYASLQLSAGSPYYYLAPEFVSYGGRVDQRADQYALGALLYEVLTGKPPRKGWRPASQINSDVSEEWDDLLGRLLAAKPDQRFPHVAEFRAALKAAAGDLPGASATPTPGAQAPAPGKEAEGDWVAGAFDDLLDGAIARSEAITHGRRGAAPPPRPAPVAAVEAPPVEAPPVEATQQIEEAAAEAAALLDVAAEPAVPATEPAAVEAELSRVERDFFGEAAAESEPAALPEVEAPFEAEVETAAPEPTPEPEVEAIAPEASFEVEVEPIEAEAPPEAVAEPEPAAAFEESVEPPAEPAIELTEEPETPVVELTDGVAEGAVEPAPEIVFDLEAEPPAETPAAEAPAEIEAEALIEEAPIEAEAVVEEAPTEIDAVVETAPAEFEAVVEAAPVEIEAAVEAAPAEIEAVAEAAPVEAEAAVEEAAVEAEVVPEEAPIEVEAAPVDEEMEGVVEAQAEPIAPEAPVEAPPRKKTFEEILAEGEEGVEDWSAVAEAPAAPAAEAPPIVAPAPARKSHAGMWAALFGGLAVIAAGLALAGMKLGWFGGGPPPATPTPVAAVAETPTPEASPEASPEDANEKIAQLINLANSLIDKKQYVKPATENALALVVQIEGLDPQHIYPEKARSKMLADLTKRFEQAMGKEEFQKAYELAKEGLTIRPDSEDFKGYLAKAQEGLAGQTDQQKIAKQLEQLKWYMAKKLYVKPAGACALSAIEELEKLQANEPNAAKARKDIVTVKTQQSQEYLKAAKWDETIETADEGLLVEPKNLKLADLKAKALKGKELAAAAPAETPAPVAQTCPEGTRYIAGGSVRMGSAPDDPLRKAGEKPNTPTYVAPFCVDLYEYPNQPGAAPKTNVGWQEAKQACEAVGKRLCTEAEWERACKGPANQRFPYGNDFNPNVCATQTVDGQKRNVAGAGGWAGCRSTFGIYDMSGNVREWTASPVAPGQGSYVIKGGAADEPDWAVRCAVRLPAAPGVKSYLVGFRCCTKVNE